MPPIASSFSTDPRLDDECSGACGVDHGRTVELNRCRSCWMVGSSSRSSEDERIWRGLLSFCMEWPHFQQKAYFSSIWDPHSVHVLTEAAGFFALITGSRSGSGSS